MATKKKQKPKSIDARPDELELVIPPVPPIPVVPSGSEEPKQPVSPIPVAPVESEGQKSQEEPKQAVTVNPISAPESTKDAVKGTKSPKGAKETATLGLKITADDARFMKLVFAIARAFESEPHVYPGIESFRTLEGVKWTLEIDKSGVKTRNLRVKDSQELLFVAKSLPFKTFENLASIQDACYKYINCIG